MEVERVTQYTKGNQMSPSTQIEHFLLIKDEHFLFGKDSLLMF